MLHSEAAYERLVNVFGEEMVLEMEQRVMRSQARTHDTIARANEWSGGEYLPVFTQGRMVDVPVALRKSDKIPF